MKNMLVRRLRARVAVFACLALVALLIDRITKLWALSALSGGRSVTVIPHVLSLTLLHNPGASLGFGSSMTWLISLLAIAACIVLIVLVRRTESLWWTLVLALAFAGACGNLIDRVIYADDVLNGRVVDFLDYGWAIGNVADIWLVIAGVAIVLLILADVPFERHRASEDPSADGHPDAAASGEGIHEA